MINSVKLYRIAHKLYKIGIPIIPSIIKGIIFLIYNSSIPFQCEIGEGSYFGYGGIAVVIHKEARIGKNCMIAQCVTIGGKQGANGAPSIGDNVVVSAGAKVIGNIKIGNNCIIGANAVVTKDLPDNAVAAGVPAKIIKYRE